MSERNYRGRGFGPRRTRPPSGPAGFQGSSHLTNFHTSRGFSNNHGGYRMEDRQHNGPMFVQQHFTSPWQNNNAGMVTPQRYPHFSPRPYIQRNIQYYPNRDRSCQQPRHYNTPEQSPGLICSLMSMNIHTYNFSEDGIEGKLCHRNEVKPILPPSSPLPGSEEERQKKISDTANQLKKKLSNINYEEFNDFCWDQDLDMKFRSNNDNNDLKTSRGIPELRHGPPELDLTHNDFKDIGRVDSDNNTSLKFDNPEERVGQDLAKTDNSVQNHYEVQQSNLRKSGQKIRKSKWDNPQSLDRMGEEEKSMDTNETQKPKKSLSHNSQTNWNNNQCYPSHPRNSFHNHIVDVMFNPQLPLVPPVPLNDTEPKILPIPLIRTYPPIRFPPIPPTVLSPPENLVSTGLNFPLNSFDVGPLPPPPDKIPLPPDDSPPDLNESNLSMTEELQELQEAMEFAKQVMNLTDDLRPIQEDSNDQQPEQNKSPEDNQPVKLEETIDKTKEDEGNLKSERKILINVNKLETLSKTIKFEDKKKQNKKKLIAPNSEFGWKNKVISRFLRMSKNDIRNMINNSSLRKFDIAMNHLVREKRSSLSLEMRNTEDEKIKSYDREEFMTQLTEMLNSGTTVDVTNLPTEFIHHLSQVLQLDDSPPVENPDSIPLDSNVEDKNQQIKQFDNLILEDMFSMKKNTDDAEDQSGQSSSSIKWSKTSREDSDAYRNLSKEEWEAKYGKNFESSSNNSNSQSRNIDRSEMESDLEESDSSTSNSSSSDTPEESDVTKLLRIIKEKENIAKTKSLNETIRDEINAEIEQAWKERRNRKSKRRKDTKEMKKVERKKEKRKKCKRSSSLESNNDSVNLNDRMKKVIIEPVLTKTKAQLKQMPDIEQNQSKLKKLDIKAYKERRLQTKEQIEEISCDPEEPLKNLRTDDESSNCSNKEEKKEEKNYTQEKNNNEDASIKETVLESEAYMIDTMYNNSSSDIQDTVENKTQVEEEIDMSDKIINDQILSAVQGKDSFEMFLTEVLPNDNHTSEEINDGLDKGLPTNDELNISSTDLAMSIEAPEPLMPDIAQVDELFNVENDNTMNAATTFIPPNENSNNQLINDNLSTPNELPIQLLVSPLSSFENDKNSKEDEPQIEENISTQEDNATFDVLNKYNEDATSIKLKIISDVVHVPTKAELKASSSNHNFEKTLQQIDSSYKASNKGIGVDQDKDPTMETNKLKKKKPLKGKKLSKQKCGRRTKESIMARMMAIDLEIHQLTTEKMNLYKFLETGDYSLEVEEDEEVHEEEEEERPEEPENNNNDKEKETIEQKPLKRKLIEDEDIGCKKKKKPKDNEPIIPEVEQTDLEQQLKPKKPNKKLKEILFDVDVTKKSIERKFNIYSDESSGDSTTPQSSQKKKPRNTGLTLLEESFKRDLAQTRKTKPDKKKKKDSIDSTLKQKRHDSLDNNKIDTTIDNTIKLPLIRVRKDLTIVPTENIINEEEAIVCVEPDPFPAANEASFLEDCQVIDIESQITETNLSLRRSSRKPEDGVKRRKPDNNSKKNNKKLKKRKTWDKLDKECFVELVDCKDELLKPDVSIDTLRNFGITRINCCKGLKTRTIKRTSITIIEPDILNSNTSLVESETSNQQENDDTVEEIESPKINYSFHKGPILDVKVYVDTFFAASEDTMIYRYSQNSDQVLNVYKGHKSAVTCLYVLESENKEGSDDFVYSGSLDGTLRCFNIKSEESKKSHSIGSPIQCMDQAWGMLFIGTKSGHVSRFHIQTNAIKGDPIQFSDKSVLALKATNEGPRRVLIVASRSHPITIRDAQNGLFLRTICGQKSHTVYSMMQDQNIIYCGTSSTSIPVFNFTTGDQVTQYNAGVGIVCMRLHKKLLFAGCYNGNIYVFDLEKNKLISTIPGPGNMLLSLEVVGNKIIAGSKDKRLNTWTIPSEVDVLLRNR